MKWRVIYRTEQEINQSNEYQDDTMIYPVVLLLASNLVHIVTTYSLGGSRANRHHTPSPTLGPHKTNTNEDPQATSNPLELPFVISRGE